MIKADLLRNVQPLKEALKWQEKDTKDKYFQARPPTATNVQDAVVEIKMTNTDLVNNHFLHVGSDLKHKELYIQFRQFKQSISDTKLLHSPSIRSNKSE